VRRLKLPRRRHATRCCSTGAYHEKGKSKGKPYEFHDRLTDTWMNVAGLAVRVAVLDVVRTLAAVRAKEKIAWFIA
jgi:hypothetical protein